MAWYDVFDESSDNWYGADDDGWGIQEDANFWGDDNSWNWSDDYGDSLDASFDSGDESWWDTLGDTYSGGVEDRWDTSFGGQANNWTGIGTTLGGLFRGGQSSGQGKTPAPYSWGKAGSLMGGLLGGSDGQVGSNDLWGLGRGLVSAYMGDRQNKRYNEAMSPLFDLYKDQAADVAQRRANRDSNLANEWETNLALMQPGRDRRDQKAANLAQSQGVTQSSSNAWNKAENEQRREATDLYTRQKLANLYDTRTGMLGGQLSASGQQFTSPDYLTRQENPYLNWLQTGITGRPV